jgi:hypothetical protein
METYKQIKKDLMGLCVIILLLQLAWVVLPIGRDDTDGETRSGLKPRTDARTGCQYLESDGGGLTPRLDREGRHVCAP